MLFANGGATIPLGQIGDAQITAQPGFYGTQQDIPDYGTQRLLSPSMGVGIGPLSVNAGYDYTMSPDGSSGSPRFGAGLNVPAGPGNLNLGASISPQNGKTINASYDANLSNTERLAAMLMGRSGQNGTPPEARFGIAYRRRF
jgi:hypothetical protein